MAGLRPLGVRHRRSDEHTATVAGGGDKRCRSTFHRVARSRCDAHRWRTHQIKSHSSTLRWPWLAPVAVDGRWQCALSVSSALACRGLPTSAGKPACRPQSHHAPETPEYDALHSADTVPQPLHGSHNRRLLDGQRWHIGQRRARHLQQRTSPSLAHSPFDCIQGDDPTRWCAHHIFVVISFMISISRSVSTRQIPS